MTPGTEPNASLADESNGRRSGAFLDKFWDQRTARVLTTILIFAAVLWFLHAANETLVLFLFAIFFAYFLAPLVAKLESRVGGRGKAALLVYLGLVILLSGIGFLIGSRVANEGRELGRTLPTLISRLSSGELLTEFGQRHQWSDERVQQIQGFIDSHHSDLSRYGRIVGGRLARPVQHIFWLVLIPVLSFFLLQKGRQIAALFVSLGRSDEERDFIRGLLDDVNVMLGSYIRAQIILASLTMAAYTTGLSLMRVPYAFILGPMAGILEFVPVVGTTLATILIIVISILAGYPHVVGVVAFVIGWRLVQDYVNSPRIMGRSLEIDPLAQILAVLAGGEVAGMVGTLISAPALATLRIVWRRIEQARKS